MQSKLVLALALSLAPLAALAAISAGSGLHGGGNHLVASSDVICTQAYGCVRA